MTEAGQTVETTEDQRNVLIAVDGSEHSKRAFKFYLSNTCKKGDNVVVFHAQEMPTLPAAPYPYGFAYYEEWQDVMKKADEEAKLLLRHYGDALKTNPDIKFKLVKEGGRPGELICKNSVEENAALIVLGCRGQSSVRRTFLGSDMSALTTRLPEQRVLWQINPDFKSRNILVKVASLVEQIEERVEIRSQLVNGNDGEREESLDVRKGFVGKKAAKMRRKRPSNSEGISA